MEWGQLQNLAAHTVGFGKSEIWKLTPGLPPILRAYKNDPRFIAFAQKIGVMPKTAAKP